MFFTICIPSFNRANTITRTLDSLVAQSFKDFEVVLIDDGSSDNTKDVVEKYVETLCLKYFYKQNGGKHTALNMGIDNASGQFFLILDSDDFLLTNALEMLYEACIKILEDNSFCGVMFRCKELATGNMIGDTFPTEPFISSYIDFHFGSGMSRRYKDCAEAIRTDIIKKYRFPENANTKFIPEAYVFDQIGLTYKLWCTNEIAKVVEYQEDGITNNAAHFKKNVVGYLYYYCLIVDTIIPSIRPKIKVKVIEWYKYWKAVKLDADHKGNRAQKVTVVGLAVKVLLPILDILRHRPLL